VTTRVDDKDRGLYPRYHVERLNDAAGKHSACWVFVLDPHHDPHARVALKAYADSCAVDYPLLAGDLRAKMPPCPRCKGCGQIADTDQGEPWSDWLDLPLRSSVAVVVGLVRPIPCPACQP